MRITLTPIGTLMNITHSQPTALVRNPPRIIPTAKPTVLMVPNQPIARFRAGPSGNVVVRSDRAAGDTIAPPTPCSARAATSNHGDRANPPARDATENRARPVTNTRRRPNRSAARPPSIKNPPNVKA